MAVVARELGASCGEDDRRDERMNAKCSDGERSLTDSSRILFVDACLSNPSSKEEILLVFVGGAPY
jgi:hypothetical protein